MQTYRKQHFKSPPTRSKTVGQEAETMTTVAEIQDAVREAKRVRVRGGGSKPALSLRDCEDDVQLLNLTTLKGVVEYQPDEYTFTARAGTSVAEIGAMLAEEGQYLPFDPPLGRTGSNAGRGRLRPGSAGRGRYRYGGHPRLSDWAFALSTGRVRKSGAGARW